MERMVRVGKVIMLYNLKMKDILDRCSARSVSHILPAFAFRAYLWQGDSCVFCAAAEYSHWASARLSKYF